MSVAFSIPARRGSFRCVGKSATLGGWDYIDEVRRKIVTMFGARVVKAAPTFIVAKVERNPDIETVFVHMSSCPQIGEVREGDYVLVGEVTFDNEKGPRASLAWPLRVEEPRQSGRVTEIHDDGQWGKVQIPGQPQHYFAYYRELIAGGRLRLGMRVTFKPGRNDRGLVALAIVAS